ncbi:OmpW family protein [Pseudoxanthomonas sp. UTMC 1351]|uniref:OmpW family protein n=1 Tax=Pseudoxanthomonas sp. UTMC 1351 TaxID=2695853 RepID=UPI0034CEBD78
MKMFHALALISAMSAAPLIAHAHDHSRFAVTAGYMGQHSNADAPVDLSLADIPTACQTSHCAELESSNDDSGASIGVSWYVTPAIAIELWGSQSRTSSAEVDVESAPDIELTNYRTQPLALTVQYHFRLSDRFTPFAGIGWQKTSVSGVVGNASVAKTAGLRIEDADGFAAVAGLDANFGERWFARGEVRYLDGDSLVRTNQQPSRTMDMSVVTYGLSAGLRF